MSDKEKIVNLLTELGVGFKTDDAKNEIICEENSVKVSGYYRFYTSFEFDKDDRFIQMGAWE